jgi:phosphate starvation-inducible PhoH-like protein
MPSRVARKRKPTGVDESNEIEESIQHNWTLNYKIKKPFHFNEKHLEFYNTIKNSDTNMVFVDGPAGSSKTYIAVLAGLELIREKQAKSIIYIRSVIESASRSIGALPGEVDDKFLPYAMPLHEKVREISDMSTCNALQAAGIISAIPVNFVRGLTFNDAIVIVDEAQNLTLEECTTILTRFGKGSKYIVCGDSGQSDIGKHTCITKIINAFNNESNVANNIFCFKFSESEIVRSKILKHIVSVLETLPRSH